MGFGSIDQPILCPFCARSKAPNMGTMARSARRGDLCYPVGHRFLILVVFHALNSSAVHFLSWLAVGVWGDGLKVKDFSAPAGPASWHVPNLHIRQKLKASANRQDCVFTDKFSCTCVILSWYVRHIICLKCSSGFWFRCVWLHISIIHINPKYTVYHTWDILYYPLVNVYITLHNYGTSPFLTGKLTINGHVQ